MPVPKQDFAFTSRLHAYDVGRNGRQPKRVIRIRGSQNGSEPGTSSKDAKKTTEILESDRSGAGREWSQQELSVTEAYKHELVVVVGELLPETEIASLISKQPQTIGQFDPSKHAVVSTSENAKVVVVKLSNTRGNLFVLHDKKDGLCKLLQLPQKVDERLFFYSEWTISNLTQHRQRYNDWKRVLADFRTEYVAEHEQSFLDVPNASAGTKSPLPVGNATALSTSKVVRAKAEVLRALACYKATGIITYLRLAQMTAQEDLDGYTLAGDRSDEASAIHNLIQGIDAIDLAEAREAKRAAQVCLPGKDDAENNMFERAGSSDDLQSQKLWFRGPQDVQRLDINPVHLLMLARGLRAGALGSIYVQERLYRAFIVGFCTAAEKSGLKDAVVEEDVMDDTMPTCSDEIITQVKDAHRLAVLSVGNSPPRAALSDLGLSGPGDSLILVAESVKIVIEDVIDMIDKQMEAERRELGGDPTVGLFNGEFDVETLLDSLESSDDYDVARDCLHDLARINLMRSHRMAEEVKATLQSTASGLSWVADEMKSRQEPDEDSEVENEDLEEGS